MKKIISVKVPLNKEIKAPSRTRQNVNGKTRRRKENRILMVEGGSRDEGGPGFYVESMGYISNLNGTRISPIIINSVRQP